jgi:hypothetical protein
MKTVDQSVSCLDPFFDSQLTGPRVVAAALQAWALTQLA